MAVVLDSGVTIDGPIGYREFAPIGAICRLDQQHAHDYPHRTEVVSGALRLLTYADDGTVTESDTLTSGQSIDVPAKQRHAIKKINDPLVYRCVFEHRDFSGAVVQTYSGNVRAYL